MELPYPELWVLELGCKYDASWLPVVWQVDTEQERESGYSAQWNCPPNGLTSREMSVLLIDLQSRGLIEFRRFENDDEPVPVFFNSSNDLHADLTEEGQRERSAVPRSFAAILHSRVTATGIARWEEYAQPDWSRYRGEFTGRLEGPGETNWSQSAMTEEFAREVLEVYGDDVFFPATIHWQTLRTVMHEPWDVFPGKQLPCGVTLSVKVTESGSRSISCDDCELNAKHEDQYRRFCEICHWYERSVKNHPDRPLAKKAS